MSSLAPTGALFDHDRFVVVLVRARNPFNIGAVARAMHDLGFAHLRVVNDYPVPFAAAKSAVGASSVLAAATESLSVAAAVADCTLVLGTTAVGDRALQQSLHTLNQASTLIRQTLRSDPAARVALLFGSEKTGLSNDELSYCHALLTIPMNAQADGRHLSMNLGQATAVCLYQIALGDQPFQELPPVSKPASSADLERITTLLQEVLNNSGYTRRHPANSREANIRRLVRRMALDSTDAPVWTGILRQLLHGLHRDTPASETEM